MSTTFNASVAEHYEQLMGRWSRRLARPFAHFAGVTDGERLIDVGCGTGSLTYTLRELAPNATIVGIDLAQSYLDYARARGSDPKMTFERADATDLPFADGSFDRALSLLVLHFIPESSRVVGQLRRVVRSGGVAAACVWDNYGGLPHLRLVFDVASTLGFGRERSLLRPLTAPGELEAAWKAGGFRNVTASTLAMRFEFNDFDEYWSALSVGEGPTGALITNLAPDDRERLREHVRLVYLSAKPDGPRSFAGTAWVCRGEVP